MQSQNHNGIQQIIFDNDLLIVQVILFYMLTGKMPFWVSCLIGLHKICKQPTVWSLILSETPSPTVDQFRPESRNEEPSKITGRL